MGGFNPDWVSPPGDTIQEILKERQISKDDFALAIHKSTDFVDLLFNGIEPIDDELALKLSKFLGSSCQFWVRREATYRKDKKRLGL